MFSRFQTKSQAGDGSAGADGGSADLPRGRSRTNRRRPSLLAQLTGSAPPLLVGTLSARRAEAASKTVLCALTPKPANVTESTLGEEWNGGFLYPCHAARFDAAGRVYRSMTAYLNLAIPPNAHLGDTHLVVGQDAANFTD